MTTLEPDERELLAAHRRRFDLSRGREHAIWEAIEASLAEEASPPSLWPRRIGWLMVATAATVVLGSWARHALVLDASSSPSSPAPMSAPFSTEREAAGEGTTTRRVPPRSKE